MKCRHLIAVLMAVATAWVARADDINVAAAISLKESLEAIRPQYESSSGDHLKFTLASSGQLESQIENGAPIDLFLSAARKQVDDLKKAGKSETGTEAVVAGNAMVLIVPASAKSAPTSFQDLANPKFNRIAVGEPKSVPAGQYAQQVIQNLKLTDQLKGRLIYGLNVRQVLQYVQGGEVDAGMVYLSDAQEAGQQVKVVATADPGWHQPIEYWGVAVKGAAHEDAAKKFLAYLQTDQAHAILKAHGFAKPANSPTTAPAK
ncbi:MAG TPA: molybdate ABC transporter substrate-binding protein [Tepidisphaeraceae bacterium]|jgi:molybdate transport system substrate-binding protein|nr:molybdate ABC transporter substrate-binding protein [Tepidisphaeraceae bacterium]